MWGNRIRYSGGGEGEGKSVCCEWVGIVWGKAGFMIAFVLFFSFSFSLLFIFFGGGKGVMGGI